MTTKEVHDYLVKHNWQITRTARFFNVKKDRIYTMIKYNPELKAAYDERMNRKDAERRRVYTEYYGFF
jgi:hypothetical protein